MTVVEQPSRVADDVRWRKPDGIELLGPAQGSGLLQPTYLVRRADGQVAQLSELLNLVIEEATPDRNSEEVAEAVSQAYGRRLTVEGLHHLIDTQLAPAGLIEDCDGAASITPPRIAPVLTLSMRGTLLPARVVRPLARTLAWLYLPPVVLVALAAVVALDVSLLRHGDLMAALEQVLATPTMLLALMLILTAGSVIHEIGHATACHYGGARPGRIGVGLYLVFPAFYTDVTDSYRLGRTGRVRTDLGGLYFNVWCLLFLSSFYLATDNGLLLLVVLLMHIQMLQQLVPAIRLDGYYVLTDLAGVPDLFARVRPVLLSLLPGRPAEPRVTELKPAARRLVVVWVLIVMPLLLVGYAWMIWHLPFFVNRAVDAIGAQSDQIVAAWQGKDIAVLLLAVLSIAFLLLPLVGIVVINWRIATALWAAVRRIITPRTESSREGAAPMLMRPEPLNLTASAFTDAEMLAPGPPVPKSGWQRAVYVASGRNVNLGPGAKERSRLELESRLRTPIAGTRRVVVMSRKGGVGKTTITLALGSTFATVRGDRVIAVDANPDAGNLAHRAGPPTSRTITHVLNDLSHIDSYSFLRSYTSQAPETRLEVLGSDDDPRISVALNSDDYHRLIGLLDHFYNLILLDTGTGILDSANQGLLSEADELVVVLRSGVDSGRAAALTLDWLEEHAYGELVARAVVVVNAVQKGVGAPLGPMTKHFEQRCSAVVTVPWDPGLETGAQTLLSSLRPTTRAGLIEMAAAVADNFPNEGARRSDPSNLSFFSNFDPATRS
jgi:putative peptide zinc metalloprotease protein